MIAYSVSQRTREIGVRMALGAQRNAVYGLVMRQAGWLTVAGLVLGLGGAVGVATLIRKMLFGVAAWDAVTLATVAAALGAAAMAASFAPARRAASVDPVEAVRSERCPHGCAGMTERSDAGIADEQEELWAGSGSCSPAADS
jgi:ABC-type antimicrobial peptide transport system permease subunit